MKKLKFTINIAGGLLFAILFSSCKNNVADPEIHYLKEKCVIMAKGGYSERNGKFSNQGKYFLIRRVLDTTEYTELAGYNWAPLADYYGSSIYYSKNIGDTLFFDYIRKERFWKKTK